MRDEKGYTVPIGEGEFGNRLDHGVRGLVIVLYRGQHGWKAGEGSLAHACLPHQVYEAKIAPLTVPCGVSEIVVVSLETAHWQTLWACSDYHISYPEPMLKNERADV